MTLCVERFEDGDELEKWQCELQGFDADLLGSRWVDVEGLDDEDFEKIKSGTTTLLADGAALDDGKLKVPKGAEKTLGTAEKRGPAATKKRT